MKILSALATSFWKHILHHLLWQDMNLLKSELVEREDHPPELRDTEFEWAGGTSVLLPCTTKSTNNSALMLGLMQGFKFCLPWLPCKRWVGLVVLWWNSIASPNAYYRKAIINHLAIKEADDVADVWMDLEDAIHDISVMKESYYWKSWALQAHCSWYVLFEEMDEDWSFKDSILPSPWSLLSPLHRLACCR